MFNLFKTNSGMGSKVADTVARGVKPSVIDGVLETLKKKKITAVKVVGKNKVVLNNYFRMEKGTYEVLKRNINKNVNTLLIGPTGTGKTEVVANLARVMKLPLTIFDMGTMSDPIMGLVGTHVITVKDGKTHSEFKKSRFSEVIQRPGIILLDEISRASAAANNLLFPVLDFRKELSMEYAFEDTTPIKVHEDCVFFATANMGSQYTGTHKLDRALIDRFMTVEVDQLGTDDTRSTIQVMHPKLSDIQLDTIIKIYASINKEHDDFKIGFNLSVRHLKLIAAMVEDKFTIYDGFYTLCRGLAGKDGLKAIETILESAKSTDKKSSEYATLSDVAESVKTTL